MTNLYGAPNGVERRAYRATNATLHSIPASSSPRTSEKAGDPLQQISNRERFLELLDGQLELSQTGNYPLCLLMVGLELEATLADVQEVVLHSVAKQASLNLRPTDILVRYKNTTLAIVLHEADEIGGKVVADRVRAVFASGSYTGLKTAFGISCLTSKDPDKADKLAVAAETSLQKARQESHN